MKEPPDFKPDLPAHLFDGLTKRDRWMYEQASIHKQQNDWIIGQLADGQRRFDEADTDRAVVRAEVSKISSRLLVIEQIKDRLSAKWTVVAFIGAVIVCPLVLAFIGAAMTRWWEKVWK